MEVDKPWRKISRVSFGKLANGAAAEGDNDNANIPIVVPIAVSSYNYKKQYNRVCVKDVQIYILLGLKKDLFWLF